MSDVSQGPGWWQAADLKWYPPELHADYVAPLPAPPRLPPPPKLPAPPKLPPPPREDVTTPSGQAAGPRNANPEPAAQRGGKIEPTEPVASTPVIPAIPWDKVRQFWSGLSDAQPRTPQGQVHSGQHPSAGGSGATFDLRAIMPGGLIAVVGGLLYVVVSFFPWYTINICSASMCGKAMGVTKTAWDRGSAVFSVLAFLLVAAIFVVAALQVTPRKMPLEVMALGVVVLGDIFFLVSLILDVPTFVSRGWGLWAALVLCVAITAGTVLQFIKARAHPGV